MRREVERLLRDGKMPTLSELSQAVLDSRRKYRFGILRARRESKVNVQITEGK
jgi:hypothetical protein